MPATTDPEDLYSAIEETSRLLDVSHSRDKVLPILAAYAESLPQAVIAFRIGTGERYMGDIDWRFTVPADVDPYVTAVSSDLIDATDHPVASVLSEVAEHCPVTNYGIDFGVAGGFKKIYVFFPPDDMQRLDTLVNLPSMPPALAHHQDFFARHGLDGAKVNIFGIDYRHRTVNVYFGALPAETLEPATVQAMLRHLNLPAASEDMLRLGELAFGIYVTLGWDSPQVERFCFAVMTPDSESLPVSLEPKIEKFLNSVPYGAEDGRFIYYAGVSSNGEENFKLQSYFRWAPQMLDQMLLSDADEEG